MTPLATENAAFDNLGSFEPGDLHAGDVLFLDDAATVFATLGSVVQTPPLPAPQGPETRPTRIDPDIHTHIGPGLTAGATLQTDKGEIAAEHLRAGQRILTRDKGFQTVLWVSHRHVTADDMMAEADLRPVRISAGALGPNLPSQDMLVPGCQRLMVEGPRTRLMFGASEVFVQASNLVGYPGISPAEIADTTYIHALCRSHDVIWADGIWTESYQPTAAALDTLNAAQRIEIKDVVRSMAHGAHAYASARITLHRHEADLLLA